MTEQYAKNAVSSMTCIFEVEMVKADLTEKPSDKKRQWRPFEASSSQAVYFFYF
jgi:hypothetical protein